MSIPFSVKVLGVGLASPITLAAPDFDQTPTKVLNGWGTFSFNLNTVDPDAAECIPLQRQVQVWYDDGVTPKCWWWGRIVKRQANGPVTNIQCNSREWDLSGIQLGPILNEYLTDPDHESSTLAAYTAVGATKSSETTIVRKGTRSMKLHSAAAGADNFAYQQWVIDNSAGTEPVVVFFRSRFYATASAWVGPAYQERGLFIKRIESGVDQTEGVTGQVGVWTPITNNGPFNQWVKIIAPPVSVPAGHTQTIEGRWYSPGGDVYWDTSTARDAESTGANTASGYADVNAILRNVLSYGQDTGEDKTDYDIAGPSGSLGVSLSRQWQFYAHGNLWNDAIKPFCDAGICDVWVGFDDDGTNATLHTAVARGTDRTGSITLTLGDNATMSDYSEDGEQTAGSITGLPQGNAREVILGKDRPEVGDFAYAVDTAANGGITRYALITAEPETTLDGLVDKTNVELDRRKELVTMPTWNTPATDLIDAGADIGDLVVFDGGGYGWVGDKEAAQARRIVEMTLAPLRNLMSVKGN